MDVGQTHLGYNLIWRQTRFKNVFGLLFFPKYSYPKEQSIWNESDFLSWLFIMKIIFISNHLNPFNLGTLCSYCSTNHTSFLCIYGLKKNKLTFVFLWHSCRPDVKSSLIILKYSSPSVSINAVFQCGWEPLLHLYFMHISFLAVLYDLSHLEGFEESWRIFF